MAIGVLAEWLALRDTGIGISVKLFLTTGLLAGFTTFSAFALDAVTLWEREGTVATVAYVAGSVILSIAGLFAGMALSRALLGS